MRLEVKFQEDNLAISAAMAEEEETMTADFGQVVNTGISGNEKDPTVPDWAKKPEPPRYGVRDIVGAVGEDVSGTVQRPYTVDEEKNYLYVYDEPVEASEGAEIFNCYDGDREGYGSDRNIATGFMSQASGFRTQAIGNYSKAEGWWTRADGQCAVASGLLSIASGHFSHAEGTRTQATTNNAHSEGDMTVASGRQSHAEGQGTIASGFCSHAEGSNTQATNYYSHAEGLGTIAAGRNQTAMGKYNVKDTSSLLIVGNGTKDTDRKNAYKLDDKGNGWYAGTVETVGVVLRNPDGTKETLTSPVVSVEDIDGGHRVTITDKNGTKTFDVMDGKDGRTPEKGKDYFTEADIQEITDHVLDALRSTVKAAKIGTVTLLADAWVGTGNLYSQEVSIEGVTEYSQVDITPSVE